MKPWQFLIQKEGDRLWTPINQTNGELEEGRYRIMAHSSQVNLEVEIRITYQSLQNHSPLSKIQSSFRRTNGQGLIMILPFTYFKPGVWELRCYGDLMSELLGQGWQEKVKLQVYSKVRPENSPQAPSSDETHIDGLGSYYLQKLEDLLKNKIEPILNSFESVEPFSPPAFSSSSSESLEAHVNENEINCLPENPQPSLKISLNQDEFNRSEGEPILISGRVELEEENIFNELEFKGRLRYQLQEPETDQIIINTEDLIEEESFPFIFNYALEIPSEWEIEFLRAEVILETVDAIEIARQTVSITTDVKVHLTNPINYTITLSDVQEKSSFAFDLLIDEEMINSSQNIDLPQPTKIARHNRYFRPSEGQILPPKSLEVQRA